MWFIDKKTNNFRKNHSEILEDFHSTSSLLWFFAQAGDGYVKFSSLPNKDKYHGKHRIEACKYSKIWLNEWYI